MIRTEAGEIFITDRNLFLSQALTSMQAYMQGAASVDFSRRLISGFLNDKHELRRVTSLSVLWLHHCARFQSGYVASGCYKQTSRISSASFTCLHKALSGSGLLDSYNYCTAVQQKCIQITLLLVKYIMAEKFWSSKTLVNK